MKIKCCALIIMVKDEKSRAKGCFSKNSEQIRALGNTVLHTNPSQVNSSGTRLPRGGRDTRPTLHPHIRIEFYMVPANKLLPMYLRQISFRNISTH